MATKNGKKVIEWDDHESDDEKSAGGLSLLGRVWTTYKFNSLAFIIISGNFKIIK